MNPMTLDFQLTAIDRALAGLLEERIRLLCEAHPHTPRKPDLVDLGGSTTFRPGALEEIFKAIHHASLETLNERPRAGVIL